MGYSFEQAVAAQLPRMSLRRDMALDDRSTLKVGGRAELFSSPANADELADLIRLAAEYGVPVFTLGGGSNILISDRGIRGLVISLEHMNGFRIEGEMMICGAGSIISEAAEFAAESSRRGLQFLYSMPGTTGGAVWMNARCYGSSIEDSLSWVDRVRSDGTRSRYIANGDDFDYKLSPFQKNGDYIVEAAFRTTSDTKAALWSEMLAYRRDRTAKGHFAAPSAGSIFKNNRRFGKPTGAIIDSLGLRGLTVGGAKVSDLHANIIVNAGNATANDIRGLVEEVANRVFDCYGYRLEPEIQYVGEWE